VKTMSKSCWIWLSYTTQTPTIPNIQWSHLRTTKTNIHIGLTVPQEEMFLY